MRPLEQGVVVVTMIVRRVHSTVQCEADTECSNPLRVNVVTGDADIWLCAEHGRLLATLVLEAIGQDEEGEPASDA